jgi:transcriptional regulator with XRE-family HTH domain
MPNCLCETRRHLFMSQELLKNIGIVIQQKYVLLYKSKLEFSIAADIDERTIRRVLQGHQNVSIEVLSKISKALNTSISSIIQEAELM